VDDAPDIPESMLVGGMRMIRDARGVRLENIEDEDGD
jgi:cyanophycin synthetase